MVSPNRQSHIVAKYGKYRNITPCNNPARIDPSSESTPVKADVSCSEREQTVKTLVLVSTPERTPRSFDLKVGRHQKNEPLCPTGLTLRFGREDT